MELAAAIGRGIRTFRGDKTQKELALALGVSPVTVWRWESGRQTPRTKQLSAIADALGTTVSDLLKEHT